MARKSKIILDVDFGEIDESRVKELSKHLGEKFRKEHIDFGWTEVEKSITGVQKQLTSIDKESDQANQKLKSVGEKIHDNMSKLEKVQSRINDQNVKSSEKVIDFERKIQDMKVKRAKIDAQLSNLSDKTDEKSMNKAALLQDEKARAAQDYELLVNQLKEEANKSEEEQNKLIADRLDTESTLEDLYKQHADIKDEATKKQEEYNGLLAEEVDYTDKLKTMQKERAEMVSAIATELKKSNSYMTDDEALTHAKKYISYDQKQTVFEKKHIDMFKKSKKNRKEELKDKMAELKLHKAVLASQHVGWLERGKIIRAEKMQLKHELGFKKPGLREKLVEKVKPGAVVGEQAGQLMAVVGKLAAPLLALGGLAGIIMTILKFNKEVAEARKQLFLFGATGSDAWARIEKGNLAGAKSTDGYIRVLESMWDRVGMKYDEALQNVGALTNAGINLNDVMRHNAETFVEVEHMAMLSGKTFGDMAAISGEWVTDMNISTSRLMDTFVTLRHGAANADMTTTRFFSSIMNAAQGLMLYGTHVEDVSTAMSNLVKGSKLGQKEATGLATSLVTLSSTMTDEQKFLVIQQTDVIKKLEQERNELQNNENQRNKEIDNLIAKRNKLEQQHKILSVSDEKRLALLQEEKDRLDKLSGTIFESGAGAFEKSVRAFEALKPADQVEAAVKAIVKMKDATININDPKQLSEVLRKFGRTELTRLGKVFGMPEDTWRLIEDNALQGKKLSDIGKSITDEEEKKAKEKASEQAAIIAQGTKPIQDTIEQTIARWLRNIYMILEKFFDVVMDWLGRDYKKSLQLSDDIIDELKKQQDRHAELLTDIKETELKIQKEANAKKKQELEKQKDLYESQEKTVNKNIKTLMESKGDIKALQTVQSIPIIGGKVANILYDAESRMKEAGKATRDVQEQTAADIINDPGASKEDKDKAAGFILGTEPTLDVKRTNYATGGTEPTLDVKRTNYATGGTEPALDVKKKKTNYATGGYTGLGSQNAVAGLVHNKEFVFDAMSTRKAGPENLAMLMRAIKTTPAITRPTDIARSIGGGTTATTTAGSNVINTVTIQVNQRDRQEIEQIVYKVLYGERRVGY